MTSWNQGGRGQGLVDKSTKAKMEVNLKFSTVTWGQFHQFSTYSFYACRSQKHKMNWRLDRVLMLSGSMSAKAVHRTLMKSDPGVNFINILPEPFLFESALRSFSIIKVWFYNFFFQEYWHKSCSKMLMKLVSFKS